VTGGQRLHRHSDYLAAIQARGEDPAAYSDYLEAFAHGMSRSALSGTAPAGASRLKEEIASARRCSMFICLA
jgi:aspartyl/asparaginyl-tRNA synthetase